MYNPRRKSTNQCKQFLNGTFNTTINIVFVRGHFVVVVVRQKIVDVSVENVSAVAKDDAIMESESDLRFQPFMCPFICVMLSKRKGMPPCMQTNA